MKRYNKVELIRTLEQELNYKRFIHTLAVAGTAASLAMCYGASVEKAELAGLLHDCAKCIPNKKKIKMCDENGVTLTEFERSHPFLIHAKLGAFIAGRHYGVSDPEILSAITWHTTGKPEMSLLEKIVYIADYIEPMRCKSPDLPQIRKMAFEDLDECMYLVLKSTVTFLGDDPSSVDPISLRAYDYYRTMHFACVHRV